MHTLLRPLANDLSQRVLLTLSALTLSWACSAVEIQEVIVVREKSDVPPYIDPEQCKNPDYPAEAIRKKQEGVTRIRALVNVDGHLSNMSLLTSSGHALLDNAAIAALLTCKAVPGQHNNSQVNSWIELEYSWEQPQVKVRQDPEHWEQPRLYARLDPAHCKLPDYPPEAARKEQQGTTRIYALIHRDGHISDVGLMSSSGYPLLDNAVLAAVRNCKGIPGPDTNGKTGSWIAYEYHWKLEAVE